MSGVYFGENGEPTPEWYDVVGRFRKRAKEFWDYYETLRDMDASKLSPEMRERRETLLGRYEMLRSKVEWITSAIDGFMSWFGGRSNIGELGAVQFVPIAVIASAVAAMGYIISDTAQFFKKAGIYEDAVNRGLTPQQAMDVASKSDQGWFASISSGLTTAALGIAAIIIIPKLMKGG